MSEPYVGCNGVRGRRGTRGRGGVGIVRSVSCEARAYLCHGARSLGGHREEGDRVVRAGHRARDLEGDVEPVTNGGDAAVVVESPDRRVDQLEACREPRRPLLLRVLPHARQLLELRGTVGDATGGKERREPRARPREAALPDAPRDGGERLTGHRCGKAHAEEQETEERGELGRGRRGALGVVHFEPAQLLRRGIEELTRRLVGASHRPRDCLDVLARHARHLHGVLAEHAVEDSRERVLVEGALSLAAVEVDERDLRNVSARAVRGAGFGRTRRLTLRAVRDLAKERRVVLLEVIESGERVDVVLLPLRLRALRLLAMDAGALVRAAFVVRLVARVAPGHQCGCCGCG